MKLVLLAGLGSFIGGAGRYLIGLLFVAKSQTSFPLATFIVNLLGCFSIGLLFGLWQKGEISEEVKTFLIVGILGGFTTFSAFSNETIQLFQAQAYLMAGFYVLSSIVIGLLLTYIGLKLMA